MRPRRSSANSSSDLDLHVRILLTGYWQMDTDPEIRRIGQLVDALRHTHRELHPLRDRTIMSK